MESKPVTRRKIVLIIAGGFALVTASIASLVAVPSALRFLLRHWRPQEIDEPPSKSARSLMNLVLMFR